jgi:Arc/MetJ-type ribon-helix-helix transcriptional regulator
MVSETVVHVRLTKNDQTFLDELVAHGVVSSRSDALRTALRLYHFSWLSDELRRTRKKELTFEQTMAELKRIRKKVYARHNRKSFG